MSNAVTFPSAPRYGFASLAAGQVVTVRDGTGALADVLQGVAAGTIIPRLVIKSTGQPANCVVTLYYFDGTNNNLIDEVVISGSPAAGSNTAAAFRTEKQYSDLVLAGATHKLKAAITVAPTSGAIIVETMGAADLT